jgi:hypothetical protein
MTSESRSHSSAQEAIRCTLGDVLALPPATGPDASPEEFAKATRERLNYSFTLASPLDRLSPKLGLHVAVARFVWMMASNNRLADIAFYEPKVLRYTDDQLTVPGSDYGMRLLQPEPGLNQVAGAIERLRKDPDTRRAALTIFQPADAVRTSNDIPCAFGMMLHGREGRLDATMLMRSNNATTLLPFNIFEFSLLMETIAVEAGLKLGQFHYFAGSMHVFEREVARAQSIVSAQPAAIAKMGSMPTTPRPLDQITVLAQLEAELRHESAAINAGTAQEWCDKFRERLHPYWAQFGYLLLSSIAAKVDQSTLEVVVSQFSSELRPFAPELNADTRAPTGDLGPLGGQTQSNVLKFQRPSAESERRFAQLAEEYEARKGSIPAGKLLRTRQAVFDRIAARSDSLNAELFEKTIDSVD